MKRPICLFAKLEAPSFSSLGILDGLEKNSYRVVDIDWQSYRLNNGLENLRSYLINLAQHYIPDLIFLHIQNQDIMDAETGRELAKCGTVVNFSEDVRDPLPEWYVEFGKEIALTLMTNREDVEELVRRGVNAQYIQTSYNHIWYKKTGKTPNDTGEIVFIGNNFVGTNLKFTQAHERNAMVKWLKEKYGSQFRVYGMNWGGDIKPVNPQKAIEIINNAKVVITHSNFIRRGYTSDRLFNSVGCGAYVAAKYYEGIHLDFPGMNMQTWNTFEELGNCIDRRLNDPEGTEIIASRIHSHTINNHTWDRRFEQIKSMLNG